ncbi:MAG: Fic family protein [Candidatus Micrarchaeota archaeon]
MVYFSVKRVKGKPYLYAVKSLRLPDGRIAKLAQRVSSRTETPALRSVFEEQEKKALARFASANYSKDVVFGDAVMAGLEARRVDYKRIIKGLSDNQKRDLFDRFTVNFTYESNAIEGNSLTLKDVAIVIHENTVPTGKSLREIYETRNSRKVVDLILSRKFRVRERDMLRMHLMLVEEMEVPSGYKTVPNYVYGREVATTPPEEVPEAVRKLFAWRKQNEGTLHPLQLAARFHGKFERIHPFEDGNGRVGRFMLITELVNRGYPPLIVRKTQRLSYFNALADFDEGRPRTLDRFFVERYKETFSKFFEVYVKYVK